MKNILLIVSLLLLPYTAYSSQRDTFKYALIKSEQDLRHKYSDELFKLLILSSGIPVILKAVGIENQEQHITLLDNFAIDVFTSAATPELEQQYRAVKYPIYKEMQGYRLLLVRNQDVNRLAGVTSIEHLKHFIVGQGTNWIETKMYRSAGFEVNTSRDYNRLFTMLARGRFDIFPRSSLEIWDEYESYKHLGLAIDQHILLHYPLALYFYLRKSDEDKAAILDKGFETAINNGSFDALFAKHFGLFEQKMNKANRRVIEIPNPYTSH